MTITLNDQDDDKWGYDLYPERKGTSEKRSWFKQLLFGSDSYMKFKCEVNTYSCIVNSPIVKLMIAALNKAGCPFDIRRHISCERCGSKVMGGYDPRWNQIVVCQNNTSNVDEVQGVLAHEMVHMFDHCRNEFDYKNIDHTTCTEIRAVNLFNCSYYTALFNGSAPWLGTEEKTHQECVKTIVKETLMQARKLSEQEAMDSINRVFPKCYQDLEPVGRRIRRNSTDSFKAYNEGYLYGYGK